MNDEALPTPCLREAAFDLFGAEMPERPVILSVPHAGRDYPDALLAAARVRPGLLRRLEDRWVDLLARPLIARGFSVLVARAPRATSTEKPRAINGRASRSTQRSSSRRNRPGRTRAAASRASG